MLNKVPYLFFVLLSYCAFFIALFFISFEFEYQTQWQDHWVYFYVLLMCLASMSYWLICTNLVKHRITLKHTLLTLLCLGFFARCLFLFTPAVLEDDFYRYFFDGAIVAQGVNPYSSSPSDVLIDQPVDETLFITPPSIEQLKLAQGLAHLKEEPLFYRVAYPDIHSIYPPIAQLFFVIAEAISSFDITVWRIILLFSECLSVWLLIQLLRHFNLPLVLVNIYWLNPLIITEGINAAHMDVLLVPFLLATFYCLLNGKSYLSAGLLSLSVGIKIWPLLLFPLFIAYCYKIEFNKIRIIKIIALFSISTLLILFPQLLTMSDMSGLQQYAQNWQVNSFLFSITLVFLTTIDEFILTIADVELIARLLHVGLLLGLLAILIWRFFRKGDTQQVSIKHTQQTFITYNIGIIIALFLLTPAAYPWYSFWFIPLIILSVKPYGYAVYALTLLLPLYDLRYLTQIQPIFDNVIVPIIFLPSILLLLAGLTKSKRY